MVYQNPVKHQENKENNEKKSQKTLRSPIQGGSAQIRELLGLKEEGGFFQSRQKPKAQLLQLIGGVGSGCRRLAFDFLKPASHVLWISPQWKLYAPLLWKIARDHQIELIGLECPERKRLRPLLKEVIESQVFDGLVLDQFQLKESEGYFLQHLLAPFRNKAGNNIRSLIIDERPHSFCLERVHVSLSHQNFRYHWSKGGDPNPRQRPFDYFQELLQLNKNFSEEIGF